VIESYKKDKKQHYEAIERNKEKSSLMTWTINDFKAVLKFEKNKEDGKMSSTKWVIVHLYKMYGKKRYRSTCRFNCADRQQ
jgi:hypothetical protein